MRRLGVAFVFALAPLGFVSACVDGVTPDCSDAATQCGPNAAADGGSDENLLPEAAPSDSAPEAAPDAADLDAGDEG